MGKLTDRKIAALKAPGRHGDGGGLYLHVRPGGSRQWLLRATAGGKRRDLGLGPYPEVGLAEARAKRLALRAAIRAGRDPRAMRQASLLTFETAARAYHAARSPGWRPGHAKRWIASLERHAFPELGARALGTLAPADIVAVLSPIWTTRHVTASKVKQRVHEVFEWAVADRRIDGPNPMTGLNRLLPRVVREVQHHRGVPWREAPALYAKACELDQRSALVFRFILLTVTRSQEARGARWSEFGSTEAEGPVWTIPRSRMKSSPAKHVIPLAPMALALLEKLRGLHDELVFPSPVWRLRDEPLKAEALSGLRRSMGVFDLTTAHGLRATFKTWAGEVGQDREAVELCLSHVLGNRVEQSYRRSQMIARRRVVMEAWERHLAGEAEERPSGAPSGARQGRPHSRR